MRTFTNERGAELMAFAERVLFELPDIMPAGEKGYVNLLPAKISVFVESLRYGIGLPAKMAPDTGRGGLIFHTKFPLGTDPDAMERLIQDEIERRGLVPGPGSPQQQGMRPPRDRAAIFNRALLKAVKHPEVTLKTEDGEELEIVEEPLPEQFDPERKGEQQ